MSDPLLIPPDDGYTERKTIPAQPGVSPDLTVVFRPALSSERRALAMKLASPDPAVGDGYETDLIAKYVVSINGQEYRDRDKARRLRPWVREQCLNLVLGYTLSDEAADAKN